MEMQDITPEKETAKEDEGASKAVPEVKTKASEETEPDHYSELRSPPEDVYSEARFYDFPKKKTTGEQTEGNARLYRAGCLILTMISLVLLLVVIILGLKLQTGSTVCPVTEPGVINKVQNCNFEECQTQFPSFHPSRLGCQRCADGWLALGRSCFYLSTFRLSWDESQRNCSSRGGSLAVITNESVQSYLTRKGVLKYWMGLRLKDSTWTWVNNNVLQKSYWAGGDWPERDCGILNTKVSYEKNWITESCDSSTYFICQMDI